MKNLSFIKHFLLVVITGSIILMNGCEQPDPEPEPEPEREIVGQKGNPQFNLQFTNHVNVDLDLYVEDPSGEVIYYENPWSYSGGELDVDCLCGDCIQGPNENIFWPTDGSAPRGTYKYWVHYYGSCNGDSQSSNFTLRVIENGQVMETKTGTLSFGVSQVFTYQH